MNKDNPDTMMMDEQTHWEATQMEDVFLPSVRVQLSWTDVESAVDSGAIVPAQAHALWASWALPGSATRVGAAGLAPPAKATVETDLESAWSRTAPQREAPAAAAGPSGLVQVISLVVAAGVGAALTLVALSAF